MDDDEIVTHVDDLVEIVESSSEYSATRLGVEQRELMLRVSSEIEARVERGDYDN